MKILNQKGFHLLHVLPMVAIVAVVAVIGVKVMTESKAATPYKISCSASFGALSGGKISYTVSYKNVGGSASPSTLTAYLAASSGNKGGTPAQRRLPIIYPGTTYRWYGSIASPVRPFKLTAGVYTSSYVYTYCSGYRNY